MVWTNPEAMYEVLNLGKPHHFAKEHLATFIHDLILFLTRSL